MNPIDKLEVVCSESQGIVNLDVVKRSDQDDFDSIRGIGGTTNSNAAATQWRHVIYAKLNSTQATVSDVQNHQVSKLAELDGRIRHVERMIHTMAVAPARVVSARRRGRRHDNIGEIGQADSGPPALLGRCPRTLFALWDEYVNGIGGNKPAREFTREERGLRRNKFKYCNRRIIWKCMERLIVRGNNTVATAVQKISQVYGTTCVTTLI